MLHYGDLEKRLLKSTDSRTPMFYMLLKIYKPSDPQQPVGSSINSHTGKLSAYVAEFLRPLTRKLPSHIWHTTNFIKRLRRVRKST